MSKKRAFVRYTKSGEIVPGSLIITTNGGYPDKSSLWKEVTVDQCCDTTCVSLYAIALFPQGGNAVQDGRAYYSDRDLQNIPGQCANPLLAIGAKLYMDNLGTIPVVGGDLNAVDQTAILNGIRYYTSSNGTIYDLVCPA